MIKNRAGRFNKIGSGDTAYSCFVPNPLPPNPPVSYDDEILCILSEADRYLGRLDEVTDLLIAPNFFVYMYARKEATLSAQIEGTQATFSDLIKKEAGIENKDIPDDVREIENYVKALNYGLERLGALPLSLRLIKEIHAILLTEVRGQHKFPGEFRTSQNWIGGISISTASYIPPSPEHLSELLDNFEKFLHGEDRIPALVKTALIHSQFEMIHPFLDGNGRAGRLLITFYLAWKGILRKPTLYISKFFKKYRQQYYDCLWNIHSKGDYENWIKFFLQGIIQTSKEAVETSRRIQKLKEDDLKKIETLGRLTDKGGLVFRRLFEMPAITVNDVSELIGINFANASKLVEKLVKLGILELFGERKRNRVFVYRKYVDVFSEE